MIFPSLWNKRIWRQENFSLKTLDGRTAAASLSRDALRTIWMDELTNEHADFMRIVLKLDSVSCRFIVALGWDCSDRHVFSSCATASAWWDETCPLLQTKFDLFMTSRRLWLDEMEKFENSKFNWSWNYVCLAFSPLTDSLFDFCCEIWPDHRSRIIGESLREFHLIHFRRLTTRFQSSFATSLSLTAFWMNDKPIWGFD